MKIVYLVFYVHASLTQELKKGFWTEEAAKEFISKHRDPPNCYIEECEVI